MQNKLLRPAWVEVDLDAVEQNVRAIKRYLGTTRLLAVVKADAYGLGALDTVPAIVDAGADILGVVMLDEAAELRRNGVTAPILNMGPVNPSQAALVLDWNIEQMVGRIDIATALSQQASEQNKTANVMIKIDTGMSRYGFRHDRAVDAIQDVARLPGIQITGAMTHFPMSDAVDKSFALLQIERILTVRKMLEQKKISIPVWSMANSGGMLDIPASHFNMVRVGLLCYGYFPSPDVRRPFEIKPALSLKSKVVEVRDIDRGDTVGYGRRFRAEQPERIAVLPIGYADGYDRKLGKIGKVLHNGKHIAIAGGLCMDALFLNITEHSEIQIGDDITLMGIDKDTEISPHDIAAQIGSVSYEVISRLGRRLPRVYKRDGKVVNVRNALLG